MLFLFNYLGFCEGPKPAQKLKTYNNGDDGVCHCLLLDVDIKNVNFLTICSIDRLLTVINSILQQLIFCTNPIWTFQIKKLSALLQACKSFSFLFSFVLLLILIQTDIVGVVYGNYLCLLLARLLLSF